jgi:hypothetical protein
VLFEIIMRRYETRSTMMTSNRPLEDWGKLVGDVPSATAILDRFLHHAEVIAVTGKSYRLRHPATGGKEPAAEAKSAKAPTSRLGAAEEELGESAPANDAAHAASSAKPLRKPANTTAQQATNPAQADHAQARNLIIVSTKRKITLQRLAGFQAPNDT